MVRRAAIAVVAIASAVFAGGCADLMQRSTIAPDWFQAKAVEVKGEGYPELKDVPVAKGIKGTETEWNSEAGGLRTEAAKVEEQNVAAGALPSDDEIRAIAAQLRAKLEEAGAEPADDTP